MVAMVAAMLFSAIRYRRISPLLWFSGIMVVILGGLTIWLHDETLHQDEADHLLRAGRRRCCCFGLRDRPAAAPARARHRPIPASTSAAGPSSPATGRSSSPSWRSLNEAVWRNTLDRFLDRVQAVGRAAPHLPVRRRQHPDAAAPRPDARRMPSPPNRGPSNERPDPLHPRPAARPTAPASRR